MSWNFWSSHSCREYLLHCMAGGHRNVPATDTTNGCRQMEDQNGQKENPWDCLGRVTCHKDTCYLKIMQKSCMSQRLDRSPSSDSSHWILKTWGSRRVAVFSSRHLNLQETNSILHSSGAKCLWLVASNEDDILFPQPQALRAGSRLQGSLWGYLPRANPTNVQNNDSW